MFILTVQYVDLKEKYAAFTCTRVLKCNVHCNVDHTFLYQIYFTKNIILTYSVSKSEIKMYVIFAQKEKKG